MKKIVSIILTVLLIVLYPISTFAEDTKTTLTPVQQAARQEFLKGYYDQMTKLTSLRVQTVSAREENNKLGDQIKGKLKGLYGTLNKAQVDQLKTLVPQNKDIATQARALNEKRKPLILQFKAAVKSRDSITSEKLKTQILDLTQQIKNLKSKITENRITIEPLKIQIKTSRNNIKASRDKIKSLQDRNKQLIQKINQEEKAKQDLWVTYQTHIQAKDYEAAGKTLDQILTAKADILTDIKARTEILKQILPLIS